MAELRGPDSMEDTDDASGAPEPAESYSQYLKLPALLALQAPRAIPAVHDEMLFIIVHQTHELWFKQILCELSVLVGDIDGGCMDAACRTLDRMRQIAGLLVEHMRLLETMPAQEFQRFRSVLGTSSGLESEQFHRLEQLAGLPSRAARPRESPGSGPSASVRDAFWRAVAAHEPRHAIDLRPHDDPQALGQALATLLAQPAFAKEKSLAEAMLAFDEQVVCWRRQHFEVARRMIGAAEGTGGSSGATYLRDRMDRRFYPELWHWRSAGIERGEAAQRVATPAT
jgi:tryptophan 2,3-dioxygenase